MHLSVRETQDKILLLHPRAWYMVVLNVGTAEPMTKTKVASPVNPRPTGSVPRTKSAVGTEVQEQKQQTPPPTLSQWPGEQVPRTSRGLSMPCFSEGSCGISISRKLVRNADSQASPRRADSEPLGVGPSFNEPPGSRDTCSRLSSTGLLLSS